MLEKPQKYIGIVENETEITVTNITLQIILSFRLLVFLLMSPLLSRLGHGFSWRWAFIMVWSEMKGIPNINMALLLAYSDLSLGSEREKSQVKKAGFSCLFIL